MVSYAISQMEKAIGGFAFVEDMDLCVSGHHTAEQTAFRMQQLVTNWEDLLKMTGGTLVPETCFWYLIDQEWTDRKWQYQSEGKSDVCLQVKDLQDKLITILCLVVNEAH